MDLLNGLGDGALAAAWIAVLGAGLAGAVILRRAGVAATYVRDLLHIGAGVWVIGWPLWREAWIPSAITAAVVLLIWPVPALAGRVAVAARFRDAVSSGDETWAGLMGYTLSFLVFTVVGMTTRPFPAAAGLLALAIGDGIGGLVGRRFGRHLYTAPGAKRKSLEGSLTVLAGAAVATLAAAVLTGSPTSVGVALGAGAVAAVVEALAPRASDNVLIPTAVWGFLWIVG